MIKKPIPPDKLECIIERCADDGPRGAVICLLAATGARVNEILRMTADSIDVSIVDLIDEHGLRERDHVNSVVQWADVTIERVEQVSVMVKASKLGKDRAIPVHKRIAPIVKRLRERLLERRGLTVARIVNVDSGVVRSAYKVMDRYFARIQSELFGAVEFTSHSFRHTLAVRAFEGGNDVMQISAMLGHKATSSTFHYLQTIKEAASMGEIARIMFESKQPKKKFKSGWVSSEIKKDT